jgi:hypothetical protein
MSRTAHACRTSKARTNWLGSRRSGSPGISRGLAQILLEQDPGPMAEFPVSTLPIEEAGFLTKKASLRRCNGGRCQRPADRLAGRGSCQERQTRWAEAGWRDGSTRATPATHSFSIT